MKKDKVRYFDLGPYNFGCSIGFTRSYPTFLKEVKRLTGTLEGWATEHQAAATTFNLSKLDDVKAGLMIIVYPENEKYKPWEEAAIITHEVVHVVQAIWQYIGEERPGAEAEAYLMQYIVAQILYHLWEGKELNPPPEIRLELEAQ